MFYIDSPASSLRDNMSFKEYIEIKNSLDLKNFFDKIPGDNFRWPAVFIKSKNDSWRINEWDFSLCKNEINKFALKDI